MQDIIVTIVFLIHGAYGNPKENWFPWLKEALEADGHYIIAPTFPTPEGQNLDNWQKIFIRFERHLPESAILIGHSIGPALILKTLERNIAKAAFLIAPVSTLLEIKEIDKINKTFIENGFDFEKIKNNCKNFFVYGSDDDPYVPLDSEKTLAKDLDARFSIVKNGKHLNSDAGFTKFPQLLKDIRSVI